MPVNLFSLVYIPVSSIFTVISRKVHTGKFHVSLAGRTRRLPKRLTIASPTNFREQAPRYIFLFPD